MKLNNWKPKKALVLSKVYVNNVKHSGTKQNLPMHFVDLNPSTTQN